MKIELIVPDEEVRIASITFGAVFRGTIDTQVNEGVWLKTHNGILNLTFPFKHWQTGYFSCPVVHGYKELGSLNVKLEKGD